jgi:hypothetical protein
MLPAHLLQSASVPAPQLGAWPETVQGISHVLLVHPSVRSWLSESFGEAVPLGEGLRRWREVHTNGTVLVLPDCTAKLTTTTGPSSGRRDSLDWASELNCELALTQPWQPDTEALADALRRSPWLPWMVVDDAEHPDSSGPKGLAWVADQPASVRCTIVFVPDVGPRLAIMATWRQHGLPRRSAAPLHLLPGQTQPSFAWQAQAALTVRRGGFGVVTVPYQVLGSAERPTLALDQLEGLEVDIKQSQLSCRVTVSVPATAPLGQRTLSLTGHVGGPPLATPFVLTVIN